MTLRRVVNLTVVILPFFGFCLAVVLVWNTFVGPTDLAILTIGYLLTGLGITVGFHRLFTHRSFQTYKPVRYAFAVLGTLALEGSPIQWVASHRKHHQFSDKEGDPHSPHGSGPGIRGAISGLWHAHLGWLFESMSPQERLRYAPDLVKDRGMRIIDKLGVPLILVSLAIPFGIGYLISGSIVGGLIALVWGGLVRVFLLHHVTFSINSICHFFGRRRFETKDKSRNVFWLSLFSFGESWHHNHHAFPTSAFHGLRRVEVDIGGLFIRLLERLGLAWDVVRISAERQAAKSAA